MTKYCKVIEDNMKTHRSPLCFQTTEPKTLLPKNVYHLQRNSQTPCSRSILCGLWSRHFSDHTESTWVHVCCWNAIFRRATSGLVSKLRAAVGPQLCWWLSESHMLTTVSHFLGWEMKAMRFSVWHPVLRTPLRLRTWGRAPEQCSENSSADPSFCCHALTLPGSSEVQTGRHSIFLK